MIRATLTLTGNLIGKPITRYILVEEIDNVAIQRKNPETNKLEQFTIRELFELYYKKSLYIKESKHKNIEMDTEMFHIWFVNKFLKDKGFASKILDIKYEYINS